MVTSVCRGLPVAPFYMTKRQAKQAGQLSLQTDGGPSVSDTRRRSGRKPKQVSAMLSNHLGPQDKAAIRKRQARNKSGKRRADKRVCDPNKEVAGSSKRLGKSKQRSSATAAEDGGRRKKAADSGAQQKKGTTRVSKCSKKTNSSGREVDATAGQKASVRRKASHRRADKQGGLKEPPRARDANGMLISSSKTDSQFLQIPILSMMLQRCHPCQRTRL